MPKPKKKDSPVGTPITTPTNSPDRPPIDNSFAPLQSESDGEEEKSIDTINAEDAQLEVESVQSEYTDAAEETQATSPRTHSGPTKPAATPDALIERPSGYIADIPPTNLERLKESIPLFASDLAKSAGKLFADDDKEGPKITGTMIRASKLKSPLAAFIPPGPNTHPRPDKFAQSLYFNSGKRPSVREDRELAEELFGDDAKPPALPSKSLQGTQADTTDDSINESSSKWSRKRGQSRNQAR
jgi:hypothetical protein